MASTDRRNLNSFKAIHDLMPANFLTSDSSHCCHKHPKLATPSFSFPGGSVVKNLPANTGYAVSTPGWGKSLEESVATHSSILAWRIPMGRGAWQATVCGVTKSWTPLGNQAHTCPLEACRCHKNKALEKLLSS